MKQIMNSVTKVMKQGRDVHHLMHALTLQHQGSV